MTEPIVRKKMLQPFGGINAQASWEKLKQEALLTRSRQECFDRGFLTVKDLDDEELVAGRCRGADGLIPKTNGKTETIPKEVHDAIIAEHELRYKQRLRQNLDEMLDVMIEIAKDDTVEPRDRLEAAKYLFERTAGKTPETVNVNVKTAPWEDLLSEVTGIAAMTRAEHRGIGSVGIVDAEFEEIPNEEVEVQHGPRQDVDENDATGAAAHNGTADDGDNDTAGAQTRADHAEPRPGPELREDVQELKDVTTDEVVARHPVEAGFERPVIEQRPPGYVPNNDKPVPKDMDNDTYGHRKAQARSYAEQAREAQEVALRRAEARANRNDAKKRRKIARALGADKIKDEITGATLGEDGQVQFE